MNKHSLRTRIILALALIVTVTSGLFATGVLLIKVKLEEVIFARMAEAQLDVLLQQMDAGQYRDEHLFENWRLYADETVEFLPEFVRDLAPGSHHSVQWQGRYYQVEVAEHRGEPVFLTYDITEWELQENELVELLAWGIGILMLAAVLMGMQAARSILAPVKALSERVTSIDPGARNIRIANEFHGNEVGQIARAFDRYLERLDRFVEREQSFTAAASHELRTPLSVMMGALDILESSPQSELSLRALERMRRACEEMAAFVDAALMLSREDALHVLHTERVELGSVLQQLLQDYKPDIEARRLAVSLDSSGPLWLNYPDTLLKITVGNLLRNAIEHTRDGSIRLHVEQSCLHIVDSGTGIAAEDLPQLFERCYSTSPGGTGLGLNLVRRICDRFGWTISIESRLGEGTHVQLDFASRLPSAIQQENT